MRETRKGIVIVEDEAMIAMLIEDALEAAGHIVLGVADTVQDAIAIVDRTAPDLVLCDVKLLNGDSGLDVAAALHDRNIPCLFVSGNCPIPDIGKGMAIGCMLKPFRPSRLDDLLEFRHDRFFHPAAGRPWPARA